MKPSLRRSTAALLASSLLLTIGRGATLPFMTIYLTRVFNMSVENIGYALTIALTIGVVFSPGLAFWPISSIKALHADRDCGVYRRFCGDPAGQ